ncbi:MAG: acetyl-CoA decarbonylase/synthase complex subunit delta [Thermoplasmata archaeon]|nr:acetyl-CoA decarbonylase/synthase complex subunit delta [Thermoplasmata archaeon]
MPLELPKEKWTGKIGEVVIGALESEGGTRTSKVVLGGATSLPFLSFEGEYPNEPPIGMEIFDVVREDYPEVARKPFEDVIDDPGKWAKKCVEEHGADMICIRLIGTNPEEENRSVEDAEQTIRELKEAVGVPLLVYGSGDEEKDAKVLEMASNVLAGERCLLGLAEEDAYKSISVASMANDHGIVAFSNLDINLAKQMNILLTDFGVKLENIIMDPLQAGLGYGLEYSYSVIERIRLAAFMGDKILQVPILCGTARVWNAREAFKEDASLGEAGSRAILWEATTALSALMAGADALLMRHPDAVACVRESIKGLTGGGEQ